MSGPWTRSTAARAGTLSLQDMSSDVVAQGDHNNAVPCVQTALSPSTLVGLYCKVAGKVHLKRISSWEARKMTN